MQEQGRVLRAIDGDFTQTMTMRRAHSAACKIFSRSSAVTGRGLTRRMRLMPNAFSANGRSCSCFTPSSRSRSGMPMSARSFSTAVDRPLRRCVFAQLRHVLAQQPGDGGELLPACRQVEAHHVTAAADRCRRRASSASRRRPDIPARGPPRRRRWRTPCPPASPPAPCPRALRGRCRCATARRRILPDQGDRLLRQHVAQRMPALVDGALAVRQRKRRVIHGRVRLDGVRQGVDAAVGRHLRRTRHGQQRIDERRPRAAGNC